jgi:eukaryotic-like serine/threonine-protein kinase
MPWLIIEKGPERGRSLELPKGGQLVFGRDQACDIVTADPACSRRHFSVTDEGGTCILRDAGSTHGTYINGWRVHESKLEDGDNISAGESVMSFATEGSGRGLVGKVVAGYQVMDRVGRGGMGTVYKAKQIALDRIVALKVLSGKYSNNKTFINRFFKEAQAAARLNHPNIVQVYDVREEQGLYLLSIEMMDRGTVQDLANEQGQLPIARVLDIARDAAQGLVYAEKKGIVHGDIKPDNLMINSDGHIKISDLGLARHVDDAHDRERDGGIFGTPHFVSPEQAQGKPTDTRSDIYSLGATLYRLIAGRTPHTGETVGEIIRKQIQVEPEPLRTLRSDCPQDLADLVAVMMDKDPAERFENAPQLLEALHALGKTGQLHAAGRGRRGLALAAIAVIVVGAPVAYFLLTSSKPKTPQPLPESTSRPASQPAASAIDQSQRASYEKNLKELKVAKALLEAQRVWDQKKVGGLGEDAAALAEVRQKFVEASRLHPEADKTREVLAEIKVIDAKMREILDREAQRARDLEAAKDRADALYAEAKAKVEQSAAGNRFAEALMHALAAAAGLADSTRAADATALAAETRERAKQAAAAATAAAKAKLESADFQAAREALRPLLESYAAGAPAEAGADYQDILAAVAEAKELNERLAASEKAKLEADRRADEDLLHALLARHYRVLRESFDTAAARREFEAAEKGLMTEMARRFMAGAKAKVERLDALRQLVIQRFAAGGEDVRVAATKSMPAGKVVAVDDKGVTVERRPGNQQQVPWSEVDPKTVQRSLAKKSASPKERLEIVFLCLESGLYEDAQKEIEEIRKLGAAEVETELAELARAVEREAKAESELAQARALYAQAKESGKAWFDVRRALEDFIAQYRGTQAFVLASDGGQAMLGETP